MIVTAKPPEQTRARHPDEEGYVERDGVRVFYDPPVVGGPPQQGGDARRAVLA